MTIGEVIALLTKYASDEFNVIMSTTIQQIIVKDNFIIVEPVGENNVTIFNSTPTIEERKRGKWLKPSGLSNPTCSICLSCPNLLFGLTSKFCPNCGAEMDSEENER